MERRTSMWAAFTIAVVIVISISAETKTPKLENIYSNLPMAFEENQGQIDRHVSFLAHGSGYSLFLTSNGAVLSLRKASPRDASLVARPARADQNADASVVQMTWQAGNERPQIVAEQELPGRVNYLIGKNAANWRTGIRTFARIRYRAIYPGVDLVLYGKQRQLEYDLVLAPGADPANIKLSFAGMSNMRVAPSGDLVLNFREGDVYQHVPLVYQERNGKRELVAAKYVLQGNNQVGFQIGPYDRSRVLVIDPTISYSTYLGGNGEEFGNSIAVDSSGHAYVAGATSSQGFPTKNPRQGNQPSVDAFVTKFSTDGRGLIYSTYVGGSGSDSANGIALDGSRNMYITGQTCSIDFPTTTGAFQRVNRGVCDAFVTKLSASGASFVYSTYLGGADWENAYAIALDSSRRAYVTGNTQSSDFPLRNAFQSAGSFSVAFVTRLNASGTGLSYSTYLGFGVDFGLAIAVDSAAQAYVAGRTSSEIFPTTSGAFQTDFKGEHDAFVTKFSSAGNTLVYSTLLGGPSTDIANGIAVDSTGNAYVAGEAGPGFPVTVGAFQVANRGGSDAFATKLNASGSGLIYSTFLGGSQFDSAKAVALDASGHAHVTGITASPDFPVKNAIQSTLRGISDAFVTKLTSTGAGRVYSTYRGGSGSDSGLGIAVDGSANAYVSGFTRSPDFPTTSGAFDRTLAASGPDAFVMKIRP